MIARQIAGFGPKLDVTGPDEARKVLAGIGRHLADTYT
jgi:hypothetical protein